METVDKTTYAEALKQVQATIMAGKKAADNFMLIKFSYDTKLVLPYSQGIIVMQALASAEKLTESYSSHPSLECVSREEIEAVILSNKEYLQIKVAQLLQIELSTAKEMQVTF